MNKFFKGSICVLALSSLLATSATAQIVAGADQRAGFVHELGNTPTGAVEVLTSERFEQYNMSSTDALVGQFAALNGTTIRGARSTNGTDALILIDGLEQSLDDVDVLDIESIKILKDAAATASYGTRAANGIILVTTKRGYQNDKPDVKVSVKKGFLYTGETPDYVDGATYNSVVEGLTGYSMDIYTADIDWAEEMLRPIVNQVKGAVQVSGGTTRVKYFVSAILENRGGLYNYEDNETSNLEQSKFSGKTNIRLRSNIEYKISNTTTFTAMVAAHIRDEKTPEVSDSSLLDYFYTTPASRYNKYTTYNYTDENGDAASAQYYDGSSLYQLIPYALFVGRGYDHVSDRAFNAQAELVHKMDYLTKGLFVKGRISMESEGTMTNVFESTYQSAGIVPNSGGEVAVVGSSEVLAYSSHSSTQSTWQSYNLAAGYEREFGKHSVSAQVSAQLENYFLLNQAGPYNYFNLVAAATYSYNNVFVAQLTNTYGGSNAIDPDSHFISLPTLGLAWNVSNSSNWNKNGAINSLKIRGSIGMLGSPELGSASRILYEQVYGSSTSIIIGSGNSTGTTRIEGKYPYSAKYEKSIAGNIGIDARLFNALNVSLDYFNEKRYDIYASYATQISGTWGGATSYFNYAQVHSQGVEMVLNYGKKLTKDFSLNASLVAAFSRNIITQTYEYDTPYCSVIGNDVDQVYGFKADGLYTAADFDANGDVIGAVSSYGPVSVGDIKYVDQNNDGVIDGYDKIGLRSNSNPIDLGLNLDLKYKNLSLSMLFDSQLNATSNLRTNYIYAALGSSLENISQYAYENSWSYDNQDGTLPSLSTFSSNHNSQNSSLYIKNTNYLRLRSAVLAYTFPLKNSAGVADKSIGVNISGYNLFTLDSLPTNLNATNLSYAINGSSFTVGVDFTF